MLGDHLGPYLERFEKEIAMRNAKLLVKNYIETDIKDTLRYGTFADQKNK